MPPSDGLHGSTVRRHLWRPAWTLEFRLTSMRSTSISWRSAHGARSVVCPLA
jgi:hypothetical protein